MRKMIFFAIIMIASVLPSASVCANAQVPVEEKEVNYFWFETDDCRAYFHWDGFKLTVVDILYAEKRISLHFMTMNTHCRKVVK